MNPNRQYIDVLWKHQDHEDPVRLVSELGEDRSELRKLEFFPDGTVDAADSARETPRTRLGIGAVPSDEINQDQQFEALAITEEAFEAMWLEHARPAKQ
ncbi:hypothetical protein J2W28_004434 [Variovorax boronicumulans]|uniref:DUF6881 domain-containing protein n=1 Tax=Variovorax boronicumulans TaxID=436515 RepID=UPI00278AF70A|nr:hypothetical protein [Variovorax boronicumulans]MDP9993864.1 hypothetical protein [Variovorax boronicumulans]MDQ0005272.1 hypothetical protein [Variovorax boronicumulans]